MSHRHFEGKIHSLLYAKYRPLPPDQLIRRIIRFIQEKYTGKLDLAVDVGCGSGQSTKCLSPYFKKVIGTDISPAQISKATEAMNASNIMYMEAPAEVIPTEESSAQLITASQAAHWLDLPELYNEGRRVLCPGGVLALYGYELPKFRWQHNSEKNKLLDALILEMYQEDLKGYWATSERQHVDRRYIDFVIPYKDFQRDESIYHDVDIPVSDMVHYFETWSGYQNYCKVNGEESGQLLVNKFSRGIMAILQVDTIPERTIFTQRTNYFLLLGRNP